MLQNFKNYLRLRNKKSYCAITPVTEGFLLGAIQKFPDEVIFEHFCYGNLLDLAQKYHTYGLALMAPAEVTDNKTWFFPKHFSLLKIYQTIVYQNFSFGQIHEYRDFTMVEQTENSEENLIIGYFLINENFIKPYKQAGFNLVALEPAHHLNQRKITKPWQQQALISFQENFAAEDITAAEVILKLLDRENFYDCSY